MEKSDTKKTWGTVLLCMALGSATGLTTGTVQGRESPEAKQIKRALKHYERGQALYQRGRLDAAIGEFRGALRLEPDEAYWHVALALALEKNGERNQAAEESLIASRLAPDDEELVARYPSGGAYAVGGGVSAPRPLYKPEPAYSERARHAKYKGTLVLWIVVDAEGNVKSVRVMKPLGLGLDQNAIRAVHTWKFDPARRNGAPVPVYVSVEVSFKLW